jgi:hypothetical protein
MGNEQVKKRSRLENLRRQKGGKKVRTRRGSRSGKEGSEVEGRKVGGHIAKRSDRSRSQEDIESRHYSFFHSFIHM